MKKFAADIILVEDGKARDHDPDALTGAAGGHAGVLSDSLYR
jgi:hypothetical protein